MAQVQERIRALEATQTKQPPITYLHLFEDQEMSMGIFCLPAGATIPLHDHPGMTVFSRVLYGQLFIQAFDWMDGSTSAASSGTDEDNADDGRPAKLVVARVQVWSSMHGVGSTSLVSQDVSPRHPRASMTHQRCCFHGTTATCTRLRH